MRIQMEHKSDCPTSRKLRHLIEELIAEERLPLAVETIESNDGDALTVRIHVSTPADKNCAEDKEFNWDMQMCPERQFLEKLRGALLETWQDHAISPLSHLKGANA